MGKDECGTRSPDRVRVETLAMIDTAAFRYYTGLRLVTGVIHCGTRSPDRAKIETRAAWKWK